MHSQTHQQSFHFWPCFLQLRLPASPPIRRHPSGSLTQRISLKWSVSGLEVGRENQPRSSHASPPWCCCCCCCSSPDLLWPHVWLSEKLPRRWWRSLRATPSLPGAAAAAGNWSWEKVWVGAGGLVFFEGPVTVCVVALQRCKNTQEER